MKLIGPDIVSPEEEQRIIAAVRKERDYSTRWNVPSWCMMWMSAGLAVLWTIAAAMRYTALARPWFDPLFWFWFWQATTWILLVRLYHVAWKACQVRRILRGTLEGNSSNTPSDRTR